MRFIYHKDSKNTNITLNGDEFHHIFGVRRQQRNLGDIFRFANLLDSNIYNYKLTNINKKIAIFTLDKQSPAIQIKQDSPTTHIIQAVIDMSEFSKILPSLNELFVGKISLFYGDFSQKNQKINIERLKKILINSSMQCGRLSLMKIEIFDNLDSVIDTYKNAVALDFDNKNTNLANKNSIIIGPEGGFSQRERNLMISHSIETISLHNPLVLRANTACLFVAAIQNYTQLF